MSDLEQLEALMHTGFPVVKLASDEETRVLLLLERIANNLGVPLLSWSAASGLRVFSKYKMTPFDDNCLTLGDQASKEQELDDTDPEDALRKIKLRVQQSMVVLLDFHPYLTHPKIVRLLKEIALEASSFGNRIILLSHSIEVPPELQKLTREHSLSLPTPDQITALVDEEARLYVVKKGGNDIQIDPAARQLLINNLAGMTFSDAQRLIRTAIYHDGAITQSDIPEVMRAKYQLISGRGALSFEYDTSSFTDVGGFSYLKEWIANRQQAITGTADQLTDRPKGVLVLGVQGCGKSLAAKAIAGQLGIPLIRFDFGSIFNKFVGESERNIRESLKAALTMAPCVLWIDEIEKGITGESDNTGAPRRVLATLLTWMQENRGGVFTVATANDITALPPELIRKGRLDEIFFVDLPNRQIRMSILMSVLKRRSLPVEEFDLALIADHCNGYSGAEIEQSVISAQYTDGNRRPTTAAIISELLHTSPLSVVRAEEINALRQWASGRTVSVDNALPEVLSKAG